MHSTFVLKQSAILATLLALSACGDDGATSTGSGSGSGGSGGSGQGGEASSPSSSGNNSSSTGNPVTNSASASSSTGEGPGSGGTGPGSGGTGPGSGGSGPGSGGEGPGSGGSGPGSGGEGPGSGGSGPGSGGEGPGSTTSTGTVECSVQDFFTDVACNTCATDSCCAQIEACDGNDACFDDEGFLDPNSNLGGALLDCLADDCAPECFGGVCDTGLSYQNPDTDACVDPACCTEFTGCYGDGTDPAAIEACNECVLAGSGNLCNALLACLDDEACFTAPLCQPGEYLCQDAVCQPVGFVCDQIDDCTGGEDEASCDGVCTSGISFVNSDQTPNGPLNTCVSDACCTEFSACTADGTDVDDCLACLNAGSGAQCNAAIACLDASGCQAGICDSGITISDPYLDACMGGNCCAEFNTCSANGTNPDACIACFNAGSGALCDGAIACAETSCGITF